MKFRDIGYIFDVNVCDKELLENIKDCLYEIHSLLKEHSELETNVDKWCDDFEATENICNGLLTQIKEYIFEELPHLLNHYFGTEKNFFQFDIKYTGIGYRLKTPLFFDKNCKKYWCLKKMVNELNKEISRDFGKSYWIYWSSCYDVFVFEDY